MNARTMMLMLLWASDLANADEIFSCPPAADFRDTYTKFHICTRNGSTTVSTPANGLMSLGLLEDKPLVVVISDMNEKTQPLDDLLVKAYLFRGNDNVIFVEHILTNRLVDCPFTYAEHAGRSLAFFLLNILIAGTNRITANRTHLVGAGVGAVIAGHAALRVPDVRLNRVTGLDPTMYFSRVNSEPHVYPLRPFLAEFIDVYHTNIGFIGKFDVLGDVDVYFNNDILMPGCNNSNLCSHRRAVEYFAETIYSTEQMLAFPCFPGVTFHYYGSPNVVCKYCTNNDEMVQVGEYISYSVKGSYKVLTSSQSPYTVGRFTPS